MISAADIAAFQEAYGDDLASAGEFARRKRKGVPADRFASTEMLHSVARGISAMQSIMAMQTEFIVAMTDEKRQQGADSMSLHSDPHGE